MRTLQKIKSVQFIRDYQVTLLFEDGYQSSLDLRPALWGELLEPLLDKTLFQQVVSDGYTIQWPNGADFCPDTLRLWCEAGRVLTSEEMSLEVSS